MHYANLQGSQIKKLITLGVGVLVVLLALLTLNSLWDLFDEWGITSSVAETRTIAISAQGKSTATPDTARFTASVVTQGNNPETIQEQNSEKLNAVTDFFKNEGIAEEDIKTVSYNLFPQYDYVNGRQIPNGFQLNQTVQVTVRDVSTTGTLLAGAVGAGANQVSSLQVFVDDPDTYKQNARKEAFDQAREKAQEMAELAGVKLGKVVSFSESSGGGPTPVFLEASDGFGRGSGGAPSVEPGSQEVTVNVTVTYEIR